MISSLIIPMFGLSLCSDCNLLTCIILFNTWEEEISEDQIHLINFNNIYAYTYIYMSDRSLFQPNYEPLKGRVHFLLQHASYFHN
jgi:hypothetical protein